MSKNPIISPNPVEEACSRFKSRFGLPPEVVSFAPGRVEILGNHTDYNGGYVMPVGLDLGVAVAAGRGPGRNVQVYTATLDEEASFPLDTIAKDPQQPWANYPKGVILEITRGGMPLEGVRMAVASDLPFGAGVSSSAAFELATAEAVFGLFGGRPADPMEEALLCQRAEVEFVGMPCGLLDQFSSMFAQAGCALFLDCATREWARLPLGRSDITLVLADTRVKHTLVDGKYSDFRGSCERAARKLGTLLEKPVRFLRDITAEELDRVGMQLPEEDRKRAQHVVMENDRVLRGRALLEAGRFDTLSSLILESHASSRDLFGNSCLELDVLVEEAQKLPGFLGGKLSGAGFGGCTVNLVESSRADAFKESLAKRYHGRTGIEPRMIRAGIGNGARVEPAGQR